MHGAVRAKRAQLSHAFAESGETGLPGCEELHWWLLPAAGKLMGAEVESLPVRADRVAAGVLQGWGPRAGGGSGVLGRRLRVLPLGHGGNRPKMSQQGGGPQTVGPGGGSAGNLSAWRGLSLGETGFRC